MKTVLIFRHQLFRLSEPFIFHQARNLSRYLPVYVGRQRSGEVPAGAQCLTLADSYGSFASLKACLQIISRSARPYIRLLADYRPALMHAHFGVEGVYALPIATGLRIPLVTTFHGFDATRSTPGLLTSGSPAWLNYVLHRRELKNSGSLFICVSRFIREKLLEQGFPESRTVVHYIGVDTRSITPRDISEEQDIVLHVARLVEKKGTEFLIRAFGRIAQHRPSLQLVIAGDGPLRRMLESLTRDLGVDGRVRFLGALPHPEVLSWIRKAAVLVLPSVVARSGDAEGLGMVLLEAAATGVPLLGTRHGGIPEVVIDGQCGYLAEERDVSGLADRLQALMCDAPKRHEMGIAARRIATERFDIERQTERLETLYDRVLSA